MAWPPAALPTNRTNATPQQDTHPSDHNALGQAINDTVGQVQVLSTRRGCDLLANTFSVPAGGSKIIAFDAEYSDTDNYHTAGSTNVVIPAGLGGLYMMTFHLGADPGAQFGPVDIGIATTPQTFSGYQPAGRANMDLSITFPLVAGNVIQATMWNADGVNARNFNARLTVFRVGL